MDNKHAWTRTPPDREKECVTALGGGCPSTPLAAGGVGLQTDPNATAWAVQLDGHHPRDHLDRGTVLQHPVPDLAAIRSGSERATGRVLVIVPQKQRTAEQCEFFCGKL